jgi:hypothetical protein
MLDPPEDDDYDESCEDDIECITLDDFPEFYLYELSDNASSLWQSGRNL